LEALGVRREGKRLKQGLREFSLTEALLSFDSGMLGFKEFAGEEGGAVNSVWVHFIEVFVLLWRIIICCVAIFLFATVAITIAIDMTVAVAVAIAVGHRVIQLLGRFTIGIGI
tara:strand:- start:189 stop:527 length:339 start_codon:yes stop_codon:yes gene_type:complete